jgi:hypothetical protein
MLTRSLQIPCFAVAASGSGCAFTDMKCQCTTGREKIQASLLSCTPSKCSPEDLVSKFAPVIHLCLSHTATNTCASEVGTAVQGLCAKAGVTITDVPSSMPSATGAAASAANSAMSKVTGTASRNMSTSASATASAPVQATGAAVANAVVGYGAVAAMGLAGMFVL